MTRVGVFGEQTARALNRIAQTVTPKRPGQPLRGRRKRVFEDPRGVFRATVETTPTTLPGFVSVQFTEFDSDASQWQATTQDLVNAWYDVDDDLSEDDIVYGWRQSGIYLIISRVYVCP